MFPSIIITLYRAFDMPIVEEEKKHKVNGKIT